MQLNDTICAIREGPLRDAETRYEKVRLALVEEQEQRRADTAIYDKQMKHLDEQSADLSVKFETASTQVTRTQGRYKDTKSELTRTANKLMKLQATSQQQEAQLEQSRISQKKLSDQCKLLEAKHEQQAEQIRKFEYESRLKENMVRDEKAHQEIFRQNDARTIAWLQTELDNVYVNYKDNIERTAMKAEDYRSLAMQKLDRVQELEVTSADLGGQLEKFDQTQLAQRTTLKRQIE